MTPAVWSSLLLIPEQPTLIRLPDGKETPTRHYLVARPGPGQDLRRTVLAHVMLRRLTSDVGVGAADPNQSPAGNPFQAAVRREAPPQHVHLGGIRTDPLRYTGGGV